ncbi:hypothetical protein GGI10_002386 [Coemansia sp. RSA 2530]|nr:hypothetical protein GGI10_002386 [Coemansia sp. RSA 2530]
MAQPIPSPLQLLPLHVVKLIIVHVTGSSRLVYDGVYADSPEYKELLKPLLSVSHNFRVIALSYYWKTFEVNLTNEVLGDLPGYRPPFGAVEDACHRADYLGYPTNHLAKEVTVYWDGHAVFSGEASDKLSGVPYVNIVFPLARKVTFVDVEDYTKYDKDSVADLASTDANICEFVQRIKHMAPSISEIQVELADHSGYPDLPNQSYSDLISQLYQLVSRIGYGYVFEREDPIRLRLGTTGNLTHISLRSGISSDSVDEFIRLAKKNAPTLQSLFIENEHKIGLDVLSLVQDADGRHITYLHLTGLSLCDYSSDKKLSRPTFLGATPFPGLRRLAVTLNNPFGDDTLFRGNAATLERLFYLLDVEDIAMLRKYKVFAPDSHPKLQAVQLCLPGNFSLESFTSPAETMRFLHNIGSGAAVREYTVYAKVDILSSFDGHASIQVLSLRNLPLKFATVVALVKSLPLLSDMHTGTPILGQMPDGITMDTLPEYVVSQYAPMGKRFCFWSIDNGYSLSDNNLETWVTCVLLLALACPNFDYAAPPNLTRKPFMEQMEKGIASDHFKPYAPRLRRLLFLGWNGNNEH